MLVQMSNNFHSELLVLKWPKIFGQKPDQKSVLYPVLTSIKEQYDKGGYEISAIPDLRIFAILSQ